MRFPSHWIGLVVLTALPAAGQDTGSERVPSGQPPIALTPAEYNNTMADLLGFPRDGEGWPERPALAKTLSPRRVATTGVFLPPPPPPVWPWPFPAEPGSDGFEGIAQGQSPSSYQVEELHQAAMHFAAFALSSSTFFVCSDWTSLRAAEQNRCAWASLERFAQRAYRRPLTPDEQDRLEGFWHTNLATESPDAALALTIAGILQAPAFHFRTGAGRAPTDNASAQHLQWDLASNLAYFLWDSMPDQELFAVAATGGLTTREGVERQARRMLDDPKARGAVVHFHHQWLGTDKVLLVAPARRAFGPLFGLTPSIKMASDDDIEWPAIMGPVRHSMRLETELFVEHTIFDGAGTFTALLTDHHGYVSDATAPIYGDGARRLTDRPSVTRSIDIMVASIGRIKPLTLYPAVFPQSERAGVLTLPSVLTLGAYAVQPGPILRGKRLLERLACMHLGTPIQGAETALPPDTLTVERTNRERTEMATSPATCHTCHRLINPPGFAFEHYDAIGQWRAHDNGEPVDARGSVTLSGGKTLIFNDGIDLANQLAASHRVKDCYTMHWTRYAVGRQIAPSTPGLASLQTGFRRNDSIKELLVSIATSDLFRHSAQGVTGADQ